MKLMPKRELTILLIVIALFIFIRSLNFVYQLNFSGDQAIFSSRALEIFRNKELVLIGPNISMNLAGRQIFQGPLIYYMLLFFLFIGNFDPIAASYIFMIFCALMVVPLYYGVKNLVNTTAALVMVSLFAFAPYYINFSRFLWNSTFQFALAPILIFLMGAYHKQKKPWIFLALSALLGAMLQFHYQFVLVVLGVGAYYFLVRREKITYIFLFIAGLCIGFSPLILFELRNQFYNTNTILLFLNNLDKVDKPGGAARSHYYLTISLFLYLAMLVVVNKLYILYAKRLKIKKRTIQKGALFLVVGLTIILISWALLQFIPRPKTAFWAATQDWNYLDEVKIYNNIKSTGLTHDFNVSNLAYDTKAEVPKYLLRVDYVPTDYEDYWHNKYLFVIEENGKDYRVDPAYEVKYFAPARELKRWALNDRYTMYFLERGEKP